MRVSEVVGKRKVDLNVDIGEGFPFDAELLRFATSANVCCGAHAGSLKLTEETVALCRRNNVRIGAHPGYPDRATPRDIYGKTGPVAAPKRLADTVRDLRAQSVTGVMAYSEGIYDDVNKTLLSGLFTGKEKTSRERGLGSHWSVKRVRTPVAS